jgi:hypothetical protein
MTALSANDDPDMPKHWFATLWLTLLISLLHSNSSNATEPLTCADIPGTASLWADDKLRYLLFGEVHGTREIPALFADIVCHALQQRRRVVVGLEYRPQDNQTAFDQYLKSAGTDQDKAQLLQAPFWSERSGRASQAMFALVEQLRRFRHADLPVQLMGFDPIAATAGTSAEREAGMAASLITAANSNQLVIALTGTVHADQNGIHFMEQPFRSAVGWLPPEATRSFRFLPVGGEAWFCQAPAPGQADECKVHRGAGRVAVTAVGLQHGRELFPGFDGAFSTGSQYSASPPSMP